MCEDHNARSLLVNPVAKKNLAFPVFFFICSFKQMIPDPGKSSGSTTLLFGIFMALSSAQIQIQVTGTHLKLAKCV